MKDCIYIFKDFLGFTKHKTGLIVQLFVSSALGHITDLLPPIATSGIIAMISAADMNKVLVYAVLYVFFYLAYFASWYWNYYIYTKLAEFYHLGVQKDLFDKVANNDSVTQKISKGKLIDTCSDDIRYIVDIIDAIVEAIMIVVKLVIIFFIFMSYNAIVAVFVLVLDLLYLKIMDTNSKNVSKYYEGTRKYEDKLIDILNQILSNLRQVKTLNMMPKLNIKLDKTRNKWSDEYYKKRHYISSRYNVIPILVYFGKIVLYIILAYFVISGKMTLDKLVLLISYFELTITCTDEMLENLLNLSNYKVRLKRIKAILNFQQKMENDFGDLDNDYIRGSVEFKNVSFNVKNRTILDGVSFKLYPNEINAIVGHSGSGKSTIINLLYRLEMIDSGTILIDDENIYEYNSEVYSSNVSGVFQNPFAFEMSIRDNLSLIDSNKINQINACKRVGIHDFIMSLPKGYSTILSEEQRLLSTGQLQLLSIARALLSKAEILLFDEVTSNIDPNMTSSVANLLMDLKDDHTIVMITHKPEMMEIADRIIVLNNGKVSAKGLNESVYNRSSIYRDLRNRVFASVSRDE